MAKEILYNGVKYPLQFNMLVFRNWETETKKKISDLGTLANGSGAVEAVDALTLLYFAIQDACDEKEIEFIVTLKSFLRNVDFSNMGEMMSLIDLGESENKRQPKKQKA
ncbi:MAG: hypothetical protein ACOYMA_06100 [Bacteroidia bacterium]|jgi:hypothetical protein